MKQEETTTVICNACGQILYEDGKYKSCKHIDIQETIDFYKYLNSKAKKPIFYGREKQTE